MRQLLADSLMKLNLDDIVGVLTEALRLGAVARLEDAVLERAVRLAQSNTSRTSAARSRYCGGVSRSRSAMGRSP